MKMEGLQDEDSVFPREIECKIISFALIILPIDMEWNKLVMQAWNLTRQQIPSPRSLPQPLGLQLTFHQTHMLTACWVTVLRQEPSLLIESYTRSGKTTLLVHFTFLLWQNVTPNTRILFLASSKRAAEMAKLTFLETKGGGQRPHNVDFAVINTRVSCRKSHVIIYDSDTLEMPGPFIVECDTCICSYSRWVDPRGHLGLDKTWDTTPPGTRAFDAAREAYRCVLSLPYKGEGKFVAHQKE